MFDLGWTELLLIGIVSLIVVGPKDLPGMFRTLGRFTGKMKGMAREFQRAMNDAADTSGMKDIQKDLRNMTSPKSMGLDKLNKAADAFEKWEPGKSAKTTPVPPAKDISEERVAAAKKIHENAARVATERKAAEEAAKAKAKAQEDAAARPAPAPRERPAPPPRPKAGTAGPKKAPSARRAPRPTKRGDKA